MALTAAQIVDARRYMGFQASGSPPFTSNNDVAYLVFGTRQMSLAERLSTLQPEEETVLVNVYLTNLGTLEAAIVAAGGNLDTNKAAVWERNTQEVQDRADLFDDWRVRLCGFIGIAPGPMLRTSSAVRITRC